MRLSDILTEGEGDVEYRRGFQNSVAAKVWSEEWMLPPFRAVGDPDVCEYFFPLNDGTNNVIGCNLSAASRNAGGHFFVTVNKTSAVRVRLCAVHLRAVLMLEKATTSPACTAQLDDEAIPCGRPFDHLYHGPEQLCINCRFGRPCIALGKHHDPE